MIKKIFDKDGFPISTLFTINPEFPEFLNPKLIFLTEYLTDKKDEFEPKLLKTKARLFRLFPIQIGRRGDMYVLEKRMGDFNVRKMKFRLPNSQIKKGKRSKYFCILDINNKKAKLMGLKAYKGWFYYEQGNE